MNTQKVTIVFVRPDYPTALWDDAAAGMDIDIQNLTVLDVCAGTGFGAKASINKGFKNVIAVDTDKKMLQQLLVNSNIGNDSSINNDNNNTRTIQARANDMCSKIQVQSVDLVICLQAFHWLDARIALNEFSQVLKNCTGNNKENATYSSDSNSSSNRSRILVAWNDRTFSDDFVSENGRCWSSDTIRNILAI